MMTRASNSKTTPKSDLWSLGLIQGKVPRNVFAKGSPEVCCLFVVCSRFFGAQIINISHVRTPSGRDEDHLQRRQRPVSYILMVCLNHYQFFVSEIRFAPISMCWFVFIQFVLWLCWSQGPKTPRTLRFFSPGALPKLLGSRWDFCDVLASLENLFLFRRWKKWWESGFVRGGKELCLWQLLDSSFCSVWQRPHCSAATCRVVCPFPSCSSHSSPISQSMGKLPIFRLSSLLERHRTSSSKVLKTWVD